MPASNGAVTALPNTAPVEHGNGVENAVHRVRAVAERAAAYEAVAPPSRLRRAGAPPCAVVALAREDGCSYELVRKLLGAHRRIAPELLDALLPHRPSISALGELSRLSPERQAAVVARVTSGEATLGQALR